MYHTGLDPFTKEPVGAAWAMHDRKRQRALMQFFKPENYFAVREALKANYYYAVPAKAAKPKKSGRGGCRSNGDRNECVRRR